MNIEDILKQKQPRTYRELKDKVKKEKLTEKELKELMGHSSYKRGSGGAIRQVK